jgi:uncharacterized protein YuzE
MKKDGEIYRPRLQAMPAGSDEAVFKSGEEKKGFILDYSIKGNIVSIEVLNASKQISNPAEVEYEFA